MKNGGFRNLILILTIITVIITLISAAFNFLVPVYLTNKFHKEIQGETSKGKEINKNSSIAIIGGADGPTAIFVASKKSYPYTLMIIFGLISVIGISYLFFSRHKV